MGAYTSFKCTTSPSVPDLLFRFVVRNPVSEDSANDRQKPSCAAMEASKMMETLEIEINETLLHSLHTG